MQVIVHQEKTEHHLCVPWVMFHLFVVTTGCRVSLCQYDLRLRGGGVP